MLVLTRREGESIMIGDDIRVTLLAREDGRTKIGIEAPGGVSVHRMEVYLRVQAEQRLAKAMKARGEERAS
jgi:carbon storage regulator